MAADDTLKKIEERLTRLEAAQAKAAGVGPGAGAGAVPGGAVVDPAPWGGGGGWGWPHWPHPVVDPAVFHRPVVDPAVFHRPVVDPAVFHRPGAVVDPAAFHPAAAFAQRAVVDPAPWGGGGGWGGWGGWHPGWPPHPIVDPAAWAGHPAAVAQARVGHVGDPPPPDVSRFSIAQLEASLHSINAEKARLNSMETLIKQQLEKAKQAQQQG
jgi:hypothetical protein